MREGARYFKLGMGAGGFHFVIQVDEYNTTV